MDPRTTARRRRSTVVLALLATVAVLATGCLRNDEGGETASLINTERRNRGIPELVYDAALIAKAESWADTMAQRGRVSHSSLRDGVGSGWRVLGENVGWARSTGEMHSLFMGSSSHRATILDRRYTHFGVGVAVVGGRHYTVHVFGG